MAENRTLWLAIAAAIGLPVLALALILAIARAPDGHTGRILVIFKDTRSDTEAFGILASQDIRPIRVMSGVGGWIAEADSASSVAGLRDGGQVRIVFRDIGLGRAMAGCLGLATGPARPKGIVP